jgi:hypothetical protein
VQNKNTARVTVTAQVRTYAQAIASNPGVISANKIALGPKPQGRSQQLVAKKMGGKEDEFDEFIFFSRIFFSNMRSNEMTCHTELISLRCWYITVSRR